MSVYYSVEFSPSKVLRIFASNINKNVEKIEFSGKIEIRSFKSKAEREAFINEIF